MSNLEVNSVTAYQGGAPDFPDGLTSRGEPIVDKDFVETRSGPAITDAPFSAFPGVAVDNTNAFIAAEASASPSIYLPAGTFNTRFARGTLTKTYYGPGRLRTDWVPAFQTGNELQKAPLWSGSQVFITPRPVIVPTSGFEQAVDAGEIRIAIAGDSIHEGADNTYANTGGAMLSAMLKSRFPWLRFIIRNFSLGGRALENLADPDFVASADPADYGTPGTFYRDAFPHVGGAGTDGKDRDEVWPTGSVAGKSWIGHVEDFGPHLLYLPHGTNNTGFDASWRAALDAIETETRTWAVAPWMVLGTPAKPDPTLQQAALSATQTIANHARAIAIERGYGLVDMNAEHRLMTDGVLVENAMFLREADFFGWGTDAWVIANGATDPTTISQTGTDPRLRAVVGSNTPFQKFRQVASRDLDWSIKFKFRTDDFLPMMGFRNTDWHTPYAGPMVRLEAGASRLRVYQGITLLLDLPTGLSLVTNGSCRLRVRAIGGFLEIWVNNAKLVDNFGYLNTYWSGAGQPFNKFQGGCMSFGCAVGGGEFSESYLSYAPETAATASSLTMAQMYGEVVGGQIDLRSDPQYFGGDVYHHPTTFGARAVFGAALGRFVNDLAAWLVLPRVRGVTTHNVITVFDAAGTQKKVTGTEVSVCAVARDAAQAPRAKLSFSVPYQSIDAANTAQIAIVPVDAAGAITGQIEAWYLPPSSPQIGTFSASTTVRLGRGAQRFALAVTSGGTTVGHSVVPSTFTIEV